MLNKTLERIREEDLELEQGVPILTEKPKIISSNGQIKVKKFPPMYAHGFGSISFEDYLNQHIGFEVKSKENIRGKLWAKSSMDNSEEELLLIKAPKQGRLRARFRGSDDRNIGVKK